jgi:hypothetical protein
MPLGTTPPAPQVALTQYLDKKQLEGEQSFIYSAGTVADDKRQGGRVPGFYR